jgi:YesN/AraC family two-component response regulator
LNKNYKKSDSIVNELLTISNNDFPKHLKSDVLLLESLIFFRNDSLFHAEQLLDSLILNTNEQNGRSLYYSNLYYYKYLYSLKSRNYSKAEFFLNESLILLDSSECSALYTYYTYLKAELNELAQKKDAYILEYNEHLDIIKETNYYSNTLIFIYLSNYYKTKRDYEKANQLYEKYQTTKSAIRTDINDQYKTILKNQYQTEVLIENVRNLTKTKLGSESYIQKQRLHIMLIIVGIGILFILSFIIILTIKNKKKTDVQIVKKTFKKTVTESLTTENESINKNLKKYKNSSLSASKKQEILNSIKHQMTNEKVYLNNNLTLDSLAGHINTNKVYLSEVLNEMDTSFYELLNKYRIDEAIRIMSSDQSKVYTIDSISKMVGFNSISTFNKYFRRITGITPSFYLKNHDNF